MNLSNVQAAIGGLITAVVTIAVSLGVIDSQLSQALIGAAGVIVPAVFVLVVAIENHAKAKPPVVVHAAPAAVAAPAAPAAPAA